VYVAPATPLPPVVREPPPVLTVPAEPLETLPPELRLVVGLDAEGAGDPCVPDPPDEPEVVAVREAVVAVVAVREAVVAVADVVTGAGARVVTVAAVVTTLAAVVVTGGGGAGSFGAVVVTGGGAGSFGAVVVTGGGAGSFGATVVVGTVGVETVTVTDGTVGVGTGVVGTETVAVTVVEGSVGVPSGSAGAAAAPAAANGISAPQILRTDLQRRSIPNRIRVRGRFTAGEMRLEQDYYEVLGVSRGATGEEIKRAFRALARRLHPDVADGSAADNGFHEALEAYRVLSHPRQRSLYDRLGIGPRRSLPAAAAAAPAPLRLEWWEAERGASKLVEIDDAVGCPECLGRGVPCGVAPAVCVACHGSGRVNRVTETDTVRLLEVQPCAVCAGRGRAAADACPTCGGRGTTTARSAIRVRTPAKVRDGDILQVPGIPQRFVLEVNLRPRDSIAVLLVSAVALAAAVLLFVYLVMR
jgi:hypothetical protein